MTRQVAKELELLAVGSLRAATEPRGRGRGRGAVPGEDGTVWERALRDEPPESPVGPRPRHVGSGRGRCRSVRWLVG